MTVEEMKDRIGLIYHEGSAAPTFYGTMICKVLGSVGYHNGVCALFQGKLCVIEALTSGVTATPLEDKDRDGNIWYLLLKPSGNTKLFERHRNIIGSAARHKLGKRYDFTAILGLLIRHFMGKAGLNFLAHGIRWRWYCTELVLYAYDGFIREVRYQLGFSKGLLPDTHNKPTPLHVEQQINCGNLEVAFMGGKDPKQALDRIRDAERL